jgi:hypothetical protein
VSGQAKSVKESDLIYLFTLPSLPIEKLREIVPGTHLQGGGDPAQGYLFEFEKYIFLGRIQVAD